MKKPAIHATDHAMVSYLEQVMGLDLDPVRAEISAQVERGVEHGAGGVIADGYRYALKGQTVITVTSAQDPSTRTGRVKDKRRVPDRV